MASGLKRWRVQGTGINVENWPHYLNHQVAAIRYYILVPTPYETIVSYLLQR